MTKQIDYRILVSLISYITYLWLYYYICEFNDFGSRVFFPVPIKCIQIFILFVRRHECSRRRVTRGHDIVRCFVWHRGGPSFKADFRCVHADDPGSSFKRIYLSARCAQTGVSAILKPILFGFGKSFWRRLSRIAADKTGFDKRESRRVYKWATRAALERDMRFFAEMFIARLSSDTHRYGGKFCGTRYVCSIDSASNIFVLCNCIFIYISCNENDISVIDNNILKRNNLMIYYW